jgi:hypothetical protein
MRYLIVRDDSLENRFALKGVNLEILFEKRVNQHNTIIIEKSYQGDITLGFFDYVFNLSKILNSYTRGRLGKIYNLNYEFYNKKLTFETIVQDLVILSRKDDYKKMVFPFVDKTGRIKLMKSNYSDNLKNSIQITQGLESYSKLRIIIFNTIILPFIKRMVL